MSTMVERVAQAIKAKVPVGYGMTDDEALEYARAAIEEMREPTEAMVDAGVLDAKADVSFFDVAESYRTMIDAALSEQEQGR